MIGKKKHLPAGESPHLFITGGNRGIGKKIVERFLEAGWRVSSMNRTPSAKAGKGIFHIQGDASVPGSLRHAAQVARSKQGPLRAWINNAGLSGWRALAEVDEGFCDLMIGSNLKTVIFGCQVAAQQLKSGGAIVNISSLAGKRGSANNSIYCAAKFGVNGITQALSKELGPRGIRVNAVCPVYAKTPGLGSALKERSSPARGQTVESYLRRFAKEQTALGRLPLAGEVAELCLFLASPAASAITGQCINVDCGVLPQ